MAREAALTVETMEREIARDIPVRVTASYIFAGPAAQPGKDCFQCFRRSLEDNKSYLAGILENGTEDREGLNDFEMECLENLDRKELEQKVALISRKDYTVEYLPVHCHPLVQCAEGKAAPDIPKIDWNYRLDTEKRAKKETISSAMSITKC